jgi:hypothetical protein|tara:strand:- start:51 stop:929 length:879 start_codon:yes stop_codon:yes gene_type:complete
MPPRLGLYSLADTPEDLLSQGYGMVNTEFADDPAFGSLAYNTAYNPAPYTGAMPFQNVFRISEGQYYGDLDNPSFGGSGNPRFNQFGKDIDFINAPQDIYPEAVPPDFINAPQDIYPLQTTGIMKKLPLDMNRFQGVSDMSIIDETTNDEQDQNYIDQVNKNKSTGIMDLIMSVAIPGYGFFKNIARGGMDGIRGLNQRIQQSDFGQSKTLADYFDARSYGGRDERDRAASQNMREARAIQRQVDMRGDSTSRVADRNRGSVTTASAAKSRGVGGGGYTRSDSTRDSFRGRY